VRRDIFCRAAAERQNVKRSQRPLIRPTRSASNSGEKLEQTYL